MKTLQMWAQQWSQYQSMPN